MSRVTSCLWCMIWSNGSLDLSYVKNFGTMKPLEGLYLMMSGVKGVEKMSSNRLLTEPEGPILIRPPTGCRASR